MQAFKRVFLKNHRTDLSEQIIQPDDLEKIKEALIKTGVVSFLVLHKELVNPVRVFSQNYADSTPSERLAYEACDSIAKELNSRKIRYSAVDKSFYLEICIEAKDLLVAKKSSTESKLFFWIDWLRDAMKHESRSNYLNFK